jgi:hypothetical protein
MQGSGVKCTYGSEGVANNVKCLVTKIAHESDSVVNDVV